MSTVTDPGRDTRRAELRQIYATWLAPQIDPLKSASDRALRQALPGCIGGLAVALAAVGLLYFHRWPASWWTDPATLARLLAAPALGWLARWTMVRYATPSADRGRAADEALTDLITQVFAQVRPGATYEEFAQLDADWTKVARLFAGNRCDMVRGVVTWDADGMTIQAAEAHVLQVRPDDSYDSGFLGWVAVARIAAGPRAYVRVQARGGTSRSAPLDQRLAVLARQDLPSLTAADAGVLDQYEVRASDATAAERLLAGPLAARLRSEAAAGRHVYVAVAFDRVVAALEVPDPWFYRFAHRVDQSHVVAMGETLDTLHALVSAAAGAMREPEKA